MSAFPGGRRGHSERNIASNRTDGDVEPGPAIRETCRVVPLVRKRHRGAGYASYDGTSHRSQKCPQSRTRKGNRDSASNVASSQRLGAEAVGGLTARRRAQATSSACM